MLTRYGARRFELPHEAGAWVELRPLSGAAVRDARRARVAAAVAQLGDVDPAALERMRAVSGDGPVASRVDRYAEFDEDVVLQRGIVGWSYQDPVTPEAIDDLDAVTRSVLFRELVQPIVQQTDDEQMARFFDSTLVSTGLGSRVKSG